MPDGDAPMEPPARRRHRMRTSELLVYQNPTTTSDRCRRFGPNRQSLNGARTSRPTAVLN